MNILKTNKSYDELPCTISNSTFSSSPTLRKYFRGLFLTIAV
jgi:hypothetical protein